jgi:hypothetical protein
MGASAEELFGTDTAADWAVEFECAAQVSGERLVEVTLAGCCPSRGNTVSWAGGV